MTLLTVALAVAQPGALPDPAKDYSAYVKYTDGQFVCDDQPYIKACGNNRERRALIRFFMRDGGYSRESAEEVANWPLIRLIPQIVAVNQCGPDDVKDTSKLTCNHRGWNSRTHRYERSVR